MSAVSNGRGRTWTAQEVLLALDLYLNREGRSPNPSKSEYEELSRLLDRTWKSVEAKVGNLQAVNLDDPREGYRHGGKLERPLFEAWRDRKEELAAEAARIRATLSAQTDAALASTNAGQSAAWRADVGRRLAERSARGETLVMRKSVSRTAQDDFSAAVIYDFVQEMAATGSVSCPGCGHDRRKLNGKPLLQAHHLIPFSSTLSLDPRWGVPLCPNCHAVMDQGTAEDRRHIARTVGLRISFVARNLASLKKEGLVKPDDEKQLVDEGWLPA